MGRKNSKARRAKRAERAWTYRSEEFWRAEAYGTNKNQQARIAREMNNIRRNHPSLNLPETFVPVPASLA